MPSLPTTLLLLFLLTLPIPPLASLARGHFSPSAFGFPTALAFIPRTVFTTTTTPRSWEVARCVQYLVWSWAGIGFLQALGRTVMRLKRGTLKLDHDQDEGQSGGSDKGNTTSDIDADGKVASARITTTKHEIKSSNGHNFTPKPLLTALVLHLISWRLATTLILPDLPGAWRWPFDLTTLIGLGTGLLCSWGEVWRVLRIAGLACEPSFTTCGN